MRNSWFRASMDSINLNHWRLEDRLQAAFQDNSCLIKPRQNLVWPKPKMYHDRSRRRVFILLMGIAVVNLYD